MNKIDEGTKYWNNQALQGAVAAANIPQVEIWRDDSETLAALVKMITSDKRLLWEIVSAWLTKNHKLNIDDPDAGKDDLKQPARRMSLPVPRRGISNYYVICYARYYCTEDNS